MRASLLGLLLVVSVVVLAQQAGDEETPAPVAQQAPGPTPNSDTPASQSAPAEKSAGTDEAGPENLDFDPKEEISEDFPVPLPADI